MRLRAGGVGEDESDVGASESDLGARESDVGAHESDVASVRAMWPPRERCRRLQW
jgi:hypothetical protein